jgi:hypothetical protein
LVKYNKETKIAFSRIKPDLGSVLLEYLVSILIKYLKDLSFNSNIEPENEYF